MSIKKKINQQISLAIPESHCFPSGDFLEVLQTLTLINFLLLL